MSRKPYVDGKFLFVYIISSLSRRKYQAGVMLAGTSQIYLKAKAHCKSKKVWRRSFLDP